MSDINNPAVIQGVQTDETATRAIDGTVYQNLTGRALLVAVRVSLRVQNAGVLLNGSSSCAMWVAAVTPPIVYVGTAELLANFDGLAAIGDIQRVATVTFLVPNGYYYRVTSANAGHGLAPTLSTWIEWGLE